MHSINSILFIGDSLTEWFDFGMFLPGIDIVNEGIAGDTTYGLLERIDDIMAIPAASIFLMIGINDILNGYDADDILENIQLLIEKIQTQSSHSRLITQSILPVNEQMIGSFGSLNETISAINASLRDYCNDCKLEYLDLHSSFIERGDLKHAFTTDGAHLSHAGYSHWAEKLKALLKREAPVV